MSCNHGKKGDTYYFRAPSGEKIRLGRDLPTALLKYAEIASERSCVTMGDILDAYIREELPQRRPSTQKDYTHILKRLRAGFGHLMPSDITPRMVYKYRSLWPGPRGNRHVAVLSAVLELGVRKGLLDTNPCHRVKRIPEKPRDRYVTDEEFLALFKFAPARIRIAMDLAVVTGLRLGDLIALRFQDLTDEGITIRTSKTEKTLPIEWTEDLRIVVDAARAYQPGKVRALTLLVNSRGQPWTRDGFENAWQTLQKRAIKKGVLEERFQWRDLRSKATERAPDARALLGHTSEA
ncbi:MAG TPA: tyrosine-type recombinase/integrase, partial [Gammaproteobacteria bacterium]|nr:tyrosine-type recombinase/integrase [Gammaproteobacteria bacterium]